MDDNKGVGGRGKAVSAVDGVFRRVAFGGMEWG